MKKIITALLFGALLNFNCSKSQDTPAASTASGNSNCGNYKSGQKLYLGPEGGCYYFNSNGNKTYVERSACACN